MKKQTTQKKPLDKRKTAALAAALLVAAAVGVWLVVSPMLEKERLRETQGQLLDSIETGDGVLSVDSGQWIVDSVDYYDLPADGEEHEYDVFGLPAGVEAPSEPENYPLSTENYQLTGIGILTIEKIDLKMPVADGATAANLKVSAGWVNQTAPVGSVGNAVIAGHRNYDYGSHFNRLGEVEVGDIIGYQPKEGGAMRFRVFEILEVLPGDQAAFEQPADKAMITLLTCTPIRTATHRLLVRAELISEGASQ